SRNHREPDRGSDIFWRSKRNESWSYFNQYRPLEDTNSFIAEIGSGNDLKTIGKRPVRTRMRGVVGATLPTAI
ncbi:hypothetical protein KKA14_06460, partial [bacterium]|nr:hypothetical protein [bacterium]